MLLLFACRLGFHRILFLHVRLVRAGCVGVGQQSVCRGQQSPGCCRCRLGRTKPLLFSDCAQTIQMVARCAGQHESKSQQHTGQAAQQEQHRRTMRGVRAVAAGEGVRFNAEVFVPLFPACGCWSR